MEFCTNHPQVKFDFFYHCWTLQENEEFPVSPWRNIETVDKLFKQGTQEELHKLYSPLAYEYETQRIFEESPYINTIAYTNTGENERSNLSNTISNMYSKTRARDIFNTYIQATGYICDFVLKCRFDACSITFPRLDLFELDKTKHYVSDFLAPSILFADLPTILPQDVYLRWFTLYNDLYTILDNYPFTEKTLSLGILLIINPEQLLFSTYIYHFNDLSNIRYYKGISS
jgi:hypothetical protein